MFNNGEIIVLLPVKDRHVLVAKRNSRDQILSTFYQNPTWMFRTTFNRISFSDVSTNTDAWKSIPNWRELSTFCIPKRRPCELVSSYVSRFMIWTDENWAVPDSKFTKKPLTGKRSARYCVQKPVKSPTWDPLWHWIQLLCLSWSREKIRSQSSAPDPYYFLPDFVKSVFLFTLFETSFGFFWIHRPSANTWKFPQFRQNYMWKYNWPGRSKHWNADARCNLPLNLENAIHASDRREYSEELALAHLAFAPWGKPRSSPRFLSRALAWCKLAATFSLP